jgi:carbamoylphosphate synthase small subunit
MKRILILFLIIIVMLSGCATQNSARIAATTLPVYEFTSRLCDGTGLTVTHENVLDGSVEGVECAADKVFGVQFQPNDAIGPNNSARLFDKFITLMKEGSVNA